MLDCGKSRATHDLSLHQANEQHVGFVEVVVTGRGAGLLGLPAQLLIHAQALSKKDAPFVRLILDRFDFKTGPAQQFGVLVRC